MLPKLLFIGGVPGKGSTCSYAGGNPSGSGIGFPCGKDRVSETEVVVEPDLAKDEAVKEGLEMEATVGIRAGDVEEATPTGNRLVCATEDEAEERTVVEASCAGIECSFENEVEAEIEKGSSSPKGSRSMGEG